ncbi:hypothetical protein TNIN_13731 [Trichonephila inaurata madagascariensis]|uniref:Uncharacterized protein n=1 Tax=Trichonephila inaurata madagascariensis TaxID=2747483 RepID=A0A8X6YGW3_9ARAC|nr:hypothetical protein TNIN_13731 [Trichonephila inaurata madagascariensis]
MTADLNQIKAVELSFHSSKKACKDRDLLVFQAFAPTNRHGNPASYIPESFSRSHSQTCPECRVESNRHFCPASSGSMSPSRKRKGSVIAQREWTTTRDEIPE